MYLILGKSGTEKSKLADLLRKRGMREAKFYITRERKEGEDSRFIYIDKSKYRPGPKAYEIRYKSDDVIKFLTYGQLDNNDFLIVNPKELKELSYASNFRKFDVIYLTSSNEKRYKKLMEEMGDEEKVKRNMERNDKAFEKFEMTFLSGLYEELITYRDIRSFQDVENDYEGSLEKFVKKNKWGK